MQIVRRLTIVLIAQFLEGIEIVVFSNENGLNALFISSLLEEG